MKNTESEKKADIRKSIKFIGCILICLLTSGCDSLRFAPSEQQKQNAWLHGRTTTIAANTAKDENTSKQLQTLTKLSEIQSRAFSSYFGLPKEFPQSETVEDVLAESNFQLARTAMIQGADRPDPWQVADSMLELGIGICALMGGIYGTKAVGFLRQAKTKSKALKEIITGNELFKKQNASSALAFKQAHQNQSPQTRQIVSKIKANA